jgi:Fe-S-cluster containining protein
MAGDGRKQISRRLRRLYRRIPEVPCPPGCVQCCGPVAMTTEELERLDKETQVSDLRCPFAVPGKGCSVYEIRPFLCRIFGAIEGKKFKCPLGVISENPLTEKEAKFLFKEYRRIYQADMRQLDEPPESPEK